MFAKETGRYIEVGGWILAKENTKFFKYFFFKDPRNTSTEAYGLNDAKLQKKYVGDLLKNGWRIVATIHTHGDNSSMNDVDINLSDIYKTPGIVIQSNGNAVNYGVEKGFWGIGNPENCK